MPVGHPGTQPNPAPLPDYFAELPIHQKIRALRAVKQWNQEDLAREARKWLDGGQRISRRGISGLEAGKDPEFSWPDGKYIHACHIIAIARALGVAPHYLDPEIADHEDVARMRHLLASVDRPAQ